MIKDNFKKINNFLPFGLTHVRYNRIMQTWYFLEALNLQGFSKSKNGQKLEFPRTCEWRVFVIYLKNCLRASGMNLVPAFPDAEPWMEKALMQGGRKPTHCLLVCSVVHSAMGFHISQPVFRQKDLVRKVSGITPSWSRFWSSGHSKFYFYSSFFWQAATHSRPVKRNRVLMDLVVQV